MIYYSKEPIKTWQSNMIVLDLEDNLGHIYVSRNTYDQAVLVADRFNHDYDLVMEKLDAGGKQEDVSSYMLAILPDPISILTPFYNLIDQSVKIDVENMEQVIGVLSYISSTIDFNMMLKVPKEVRANLVYTKSILLDYQKQFDDFNFKFIKELKEDKNLNDAPESDDSDDSIEDEDDIEDEFDWEEMKKEIGWDDIQIPEVSNVASVEKEEDDRNDSSEVVGSSLIANEEEETRKSYESIVDLFSK